MARNNGRKVTTMDILVQRFAVADKEAPVKTDIRIDVHFGSE